MYDHKCRVCPRVQDIWSRLPDMALRVVAYVHRVLTPEFHGVASLARFGRSFGDRVVAPEVLQYPKPMIGDLIVGWGELEIRLILEVSVCQKVWIRKLVGSLQDCRS